MSKTKKIISMILVAVLVMSSCPLGLGALSTVASAADYTDVGWSATAPQGVQASVTGDEVIRVAYARYSYLNGTHIVAANDAGVPEGNTSGDYLSSYAFNGDTPDAPAVTLTLGQKPDFTPTVTVSGPAGTNVTLSNPQEAGNSYTWTYDVTKTDNPLTAPEGATLIYTFNYIIDGVNYTSYGSANVQEIASPVGSSMLRFRNATSDKARFSVLTMLRAKGLYGRIGYEAGSNGWGTLHTGDEYAQVNMNVDKNSFGRSPAANISTVLMTRGLANTNHLSVWARSSLANSTDEWDYNGYADDQNRSRADIFIDRSVDKSAADIKFTGSMLAIGDPANENNADTYNDATFDRYAVYLNSSQAPQSIGTNVNDASSHFDFNLVNGNGVNNNKVKGAYNYWPLAGDIFTGSNTFIAKNNTVTAKGTPQYLSISYGISCTSDGKVARQLGSMGLYFYVTDKADLRGVIETVSGARSSYTITDYAGTNTSRKDNTFTASMGVNPQSGNFSSGYSAFVSAYQAACAELANGKSANQMYIDQCTNNLIDAYNALDPADATVEAELLILGTTTPVPGTSGLTRTYTTVAGSDVVCTAPDITGYTLKSPRTTSLVADNGKKVQIYYEKQKVAFTFDPVVVDAGDPKPGIRQPEYGESITPESIAPAFTYTGYRITGWYWDQALTNKATTLDVGSTPGTTLYAKWDIAPVVLKYNLGSTGVTMADVEYYPGDRLVKPADPDITGYGFLGWYKEASFINSFDWNAIVPGLGEAGYTSTITAYAKFESFDGFVKFQSNGADGGDACTSIDLSTYSAGQTVTLPQPAKQGYTFGGWYVHSDFSDATHYTTGLALTESLKTSGVMLYAKWIPNELTINFDIKYNQYSASPIDTQTNPASIKGLVGDSIADTIAASAGQMKYPAHPVKYGYEFKGWTSSSRQIFDTESAYRTAVNNGYRYDIEEAGAIFQPTTESYIELFPMWVKTNTSAYIDVDAYEMSYGEAVPVDESNIDTGDIITVRMTPHTNFYTGSSLFVYMYDKNFFELVGSGDDAFNLNTESSYITTIGASEFSGYTASDASLVPDGVTYPAGTAAADYSWIQIAIDPDVEGGKYYPGATDDTWVVEFKLRVKATTPGATGTVFMDEAWTRTTENNAGTMFFGWCSNANTPVWQSHNNYVDPDLTFATATVTLDAVDEPVVKITADPNGGTWPSDSSTGTKDYQGDAGEEISDYAEPTRTGYTLDGWATEDGTDTWISGFYGAPEQNGKTYLAQWQGVTVTNTFNYNDGTGTTKTADSVYGSDISKPADPTRQGYSFSGWALTADATEPLATLGTQNTEEGTTFYGVWGPATDTPYKVVVSYYNNAGNLTTREFAVQAAGGKEYTGTTGATVHLLADTTGYTDSATDVYLSYADLPTSVANYVFDPTSANNVTECTIEADGSGKIYVFYVGKYVETTFSANNGTFTVPTPADTMDYSSEAIYGTGKGVGGKYVSDTSYIFGAAFGGTVTAPSNPSRYGYDFLGWNSSSPTATTAANITAANSDKTYYAVWKGKTVTNIFDADGGNFSGEAAKSVDSTFGKTITLPTVPQKAGYEFKGWATTAGQNAGSTSLGTQNTETPATYYAAWELTEQPYNINVYYMNADGTYPSAASTTATGSGIGEVTVPYTSYEKTGFTFDADNSEITKTLDSSTAGTAVTFVIKFARVKYTFEVVDGAASKTEQLYYGAEVTTPTPAGKLGWVFTEWTWYQDDVAGTKPATMPAAAVKAVANYAVDNFDVLFMANGGEWTDGATSKTVTGDYETAIVAPATDPEKAGYSFKGWAETDDATAALEDLGNVPANDDKVFYAYYEANEYTVKFDANTGAWGSDTTKSVVSTFDSAITLPEVPVKAGYTFNGWADNASAATGSTELGNLTTIGNDALTYYAVWAPETHNYTVKIFNMKTDGTYNETADQTITDLEGVVATTVTYTASPATGFEVDGTKTNVLSGTVPATGTLELVVYYARQKHTITYGGRINLGEFTDAADNQTSISLTSRVDTYYYGETVVPATITRTGYTAEWTGTIPTTMDVEDVNVTIKWTANPYIVVFDANTGAWEDGDTTKEVTSTFDEAIAIPTNAPEKTGYSFKGWADSAAATTGSIGLGDLETAGDRELTFYAVYEINSYTLTVNYTGAGEATPMAHTESVEYGDTYTVDSPAVEGYTPDKATVTGTMPDDAVTVTVTYTPNNYTLTYYVDGEAYGEAEEVAFGTAITAKAAPTKYGYTFSGWQNVPATMPSRAVDITGTFTANTITNTFNANEGEWADGATKAVDSTFDSEINTPADPERAGYTFKGWAAAADAADAANLGNQLTEDTATYYAVWAPESHTYIINTYYMGLDGTYADTADETDNTNTADVDSTASCTPADSIEGFTLDTDNSTLSSTVPATGTLVLTVKYSRNQNDIIYKVDNEEYQTVNDVYYGAAVTTIAEPTKEGYTFSGWQGAQDTMPDEDLTITGTFTINSYDLVINYQYADGTKAADSVETKVEYAEGYTYESPAITGYTPDKAVVSGTMPADDVTVTVTYTVNSYKLTVNYTGAGDATPRAYTADVNYGASYSVPSPAVTGYTPDKATVSGTMPAEAVTVDVTYTANKYLLTVNYTGAGDATPEAHTEEVAFGSTYDVASPAVTGYTPNKVSVSGTMPSEPVTVEVTYTVNSYVLTFVAPKLKADGTLTTVDLSDASTYDVVSKNDVVNYNTAIVAPTAPAIANYAFVEWVDIAEAMPAADLTVIASYERVEVALDIEAGSTTVIDKREDGENFNGYIYGLTADRLSVDSFKNDYVKVIGNGHIEVTPAFNYRQFNIVGTGTKVELYDDLTNELVETYYVVVYGDLNGDGYCSATDVAMARNEVAAKEAVSIFDGETKTNWSIAADGINDINPDEEFAPQFLAADLNGDGFLTATDVSIIMELADWATTVDQTTGTVAAL